MTSKADWPVVGSLIDPDSNERLFFDEHEWETIEAATARVLPTDHDPGAREAGVVRFIDRYLGGTDYIFAAADGSGYLKMSGMPEDAWKERIVAMQKAYRDGIRRLDEIARESFGSPFKSLGEENQDAALELLSGAPRPERVRLGKGEAVGTFLQGLSDEGMDFFHALLLHTRQGFYGDPIYGGNRDRVGWETIGFPGPKSLADTNDCTYSVKEYFVHEYDWADLIPYLRDRERSRTEEERRP